MFRQKQASPSAGEDNILTQAVRRTRGAFRTVALFSFCMNLLVLAGPIYMLQVYDRVLGSYKVETLILLTVMLALAIGTWAALDGLRTGITVRLGAWLTRSIGPHFMEFGVRARLDGKQAGAFAFRDIEKIQSFIATQGMTAIFDAPWTPIFIIIIWALHPWLGVFALCSAILLLSLSVINAVATHGPLERAEDHQRQTFQTAEAAILNAEPVSAMGMLPALQKRWSETNQEAETELLRMNQRGGIFGSIVKFSRSFLQSAILGLGAYLVIRGEMTAGMMIAGSILLGRALAPVDQAIGTWKSFDSARSAYRRLVEHADEYPPLPRRFTMPTPKGGLEVEDLTVYVNNRLVLDQVSFEVSPGEAVAVIGPSAAGKSTLCKAIVGITFKDDGAIRLDGVDMSLWNPDELGQNIGYLPQDGGLFAGTVRENISRLQEAPDAAIVDAARLAHAHEMIAVLPDGYETKLGPGGLGLSGGQRQRLGLARAVYGLPPLIVLDEPNANLDGAGEAALAESILELKKKGCTLLIVGHRPSTIAQADKILLLADGEVQAFGPRSEVLEEMREAARITTSSGEDSDSSEKDESADGADRGAATPAPFRASTTGPAER
ncbi:type I secretion system permease/ATPase [Tropicimonas marinistellae]|uniref:type I secretion system permease/ATPase n=1 Tax=Tropicimonas marinistellae TaxID=1739787 RepID=UPI000829DDCA|nr:type I secretion system permease/ATPase [Tropicimonas marinistellae]